MLEIQTAASRTAFLFVTTKGAPSVGQVDIEVSGALYITLVKRAEKIRKC